MKNKIPLFTLTGVLLLVAMLLAGSAVPDAQAQPVVFINEIHYDNASTDTGEAIEVAGPAGTDLTGWSLVRYNGNGGAVYGTDLLSGVIPDQSNGFGFVVINYPVNGLQNGSPDGVALVDASNVVIQFLSYEGSFVAVGGPADGMTSTDIVVSEGGSDPIGYSLQLAGTGTTYSDFSWAAAQQNTFGDVNTGQTFGGSSGPNGPVINEFSASTTGADVEYVEVYGEAYTDYSVYTILEIEGDSSSNEGTVDEVVAVGTTDAAGFWLGSLPSNALENGTVSLLLVNNFTGSFGTDLDTDDDGVFDATPWDEIVDSVAVNDGGSGDITYGVPALGPNYDGVSNFAPGGASRIPDGLDTDSASDWVRNDFDLAGIPGFDGSPVLGEALNTPGEPNQLYVPPPEACGDPFTFIYDVQGDGATSPLVGTEVAIEGVVVGDFQATADNNYLNGFHVQDPTGDGNSATSDGVFVYAPGGMDVSVGDAVRVRGYVSEYNGMTEVSASQIWLCSSGSSVAPTALSLPVASVDDFEPYEGMLVTFPQALVISEYFNFDRYNETVLTSVRHTQPTAEFEPGSPEAAAAEQAYQLDRITLDDGRTNQNPDPAIHPNGYIFNLNNLFRGGGTIEGVTGVIDYSFGLYRIQPTTTATYSDAGNGRPAEPADVGGSLKVASFNVLNYFTTIDNGVDICGPLQDQECRGADTAEEFTRQRAKIIAALTAIDADVVGLIEIENNPGDVPTADLVSGLNDMMGAETYDYIATGAIGGDAIRVALIYKPATVTPVGGFAVLDSSVDPTFNDEKNRPVLAQTFMDDQTGGLVTVAVNHLKSKGSDCNDLNDPDTGDGQGNCNITRTNAATALANWLATDPTGSKDPDVLIIGDLNSYDKEDPIDALRAGGYSDLINYYLGEYAYSYVFDGRTGYLDYALANGSLAGQVTGTTVWHINADEADLIDYDMSFKKDAQDAIYAPDAYRASDHDPVIVGLDLNSPPVCSTAVPDPEELWPANHKLVPVSVQGVTDPEGDAFTIMIDGIWQDEPVNGDNDGNTSPDAFIYGPNDFELRAERDGEANGRAYHVYFTAADATGSCSSEVVVYAPLNKGKYGPRVDDGPLYDSTLE
jgi:predicted extracellular nuclease